MPVWQSQRLPFMFFMTFVCGINSPSSIMATFALTPGCVGDNVASMNVAKFQPETVASFLKRRKIAMLGEIGEAMAVM